MSTEHLVLGNITDFITGERLVETHDERARQQIARFLVETKGFSKRDIAVRRKILLSVDGQEAEARVDFVLQIEGRAFAVVIFGPGSLVSRERPALATARLLESYVVPVAVVTNGEDAEVLETNSGSVVAEGLTGIPDKTEAVSRMETFVPETLPEGRLEKERRILFAYDVLAEKECDEFTCSL